MFICLNYKMYMIIYISHFTFHISYVHYCNNIPCICTIYMYIVHTCTCTVGLWYKATCDSYTLWSEGMSNFIFNYSIIWGNTYQVIKYQYCTITCIYTQTYTLHVHVPNFRLKTTLLYMLVRLHTIMYIVYEYIY